MKRRESYLSAINSTGGIDGINKSVAMAGTVISQGSNKSSTYGISRTTVKLVISAEGMEENLPGQFLS